MTEFWGELFLQKTGGFALITQPPVVFFFFFIAGSLWPAMCRAAPSVSCHTLPIGALHNGL